MKNNPRITAKERGLIKGAIRRAFARSDLHRQVVDASRIDHSDPNKPRVKKWSRCNVCKSPVPTYLVCIDHIEPIIAVDSSFEDQGADITIDRTWCIVEKLQAICPACHDVKSSIEREHRKKNKKAKKDLQVKKK